MQYLWQKKKKITTLESPLNPFKVNEIKQFGIWKKNYIAR